jgi:hypothetical protein
MSLNKYFDKIYVLNLHKRKYRLSSIESKLKRFGILYDVFGATDGSTMKSIWEKFNNPYFTSPNYLACAVSHLSIYQDAIENSYERILILEDDVLLNNNINILFEQSNIPDWSDLLYLGYIPLSDDQTMWNYSVVNVSPQFQNGLFIPKSFSPKNLWGLFSYGITKNLMIEILNVYKNSFPMEIDRYFVNNIQPRGKSIAISPQLFCCQDIYSDNMGSMQYDMKIRSIDTRFAHIDSYE